MRLLIVPLSTRSRLIIAQRTAVTLQPNLPQTVDEKIAKRAHKMWSAWEGSSTWWKKKVTAWGNKVMNTVPYEEWSLKGFPHAPPGLFNDPPARWWEIWKPQLPSNPDSESAALISSSVVPVVYPSGLIKDEQVSILLNDLALRGVPKHKKLMIWSLVASPLTLPVALFPVIPNIPGFYLLYRAWSHWKAWEGAKLLARIIKENKIILEPSHTLASIYDSSLPSEDSLEKLILQDSAVNKIVEVLGAEEISGELHRALGQVRKKLETSQKEKE
ncbi:mitochondrial K+-H+ exchange-related-domain-containing protein [Lipomyces japonicus]|uniref:mitochondrial K+-H+ exchange-related-domain-containing protein n=1 Tax=Lipomyces japonicus TaxID=56871 RepID=UPI0034CE0D33